VGKLGCSYRGRRSGIFRITPQWRPERFLMPAICLLKDIAQAKSLSN
jgi:hypothetical protein